MSTPDLSNLAACTDDARRAALDGDPGPADPTDYHELRGRLAQARHKLPALYQQVVYDPYVAVLDQLGPQGFASILLSDPQRESNAGLMLDLAHAILQNGERYEQLATDGFQEVVADLYDGFLSEEDRRGVEPPDKGAIAPLVKWGSPDFGPYTFTITATSIFGANAPIVSLPPANARRGLMAWAALGHETAGHDILHADTGLHADLASEVRSALAGTAHRLADYWADKIDESASDVLGILNMGPASGIGLISYFRGLQAAYSGTPTLRNSGGRYTHHPVDILRAFLAAATVKLLSFSDSNAWSEAIEAEARGDLQQIQIGGEAIDHDVAIESAGKTANAIAESRVESLENHSLLEIQDWTDADEEIIAQLTQLMTRTGAVPQVLASGIYAAHVVAAAVVTALKKGADISLTFARMLSLLKPMHDSNPSWGPLFVRHAGDVSRHRAHERD